MRDCGIALEVASKVERGARWRGNRKIAGVDDLILADPLLADHNSRSAPAVLGDQLDRRRIVNPRDAMQSGSGSPGDDA